ncbi:polymer-forming cytoskeletal protein [Catalinimonas alkaloidigena]|nr:polymer-forming cytoskeletal protein [Catalinimonas alkaloidigena]
MFNSSSSSKETRRDTPEVGVLSNHIQKGTSIQGDIDTTGNIRIDGRVTGNVRSKARIVLGESAHIEGDIEAQNAEVQGYMKGKLEVAELLVLKPSARIDGDIYANKMMVESGAVFNGQCHMGVKGKEQADSSHGKQQPQVQPHKNGQKVTV